MVLKEIDKVFMSDDTFIGFLLPKNRYQQTAQELGSLLREICKQSGKTKVTCLQSLKMHGHPCV